MRTHDAQQVCDSGAREYGVAAHANLRKARVDEIEELAERGRPVERLTEPRRVCRPSREGCDPRTCVSRIRAEAKCDHADQASAVGVGPDRADDLHVRMDVANCARQPRRDRGQRIEPERGAVDMNCAR